MLIVLSACARATANLPGGCHALRGFYPLADMGNLEGLNRRMVVAAANWSVTYGHDATTFYVSLDSDKREVQVVDEAECNAELHIGCAGFCATLTYDPERDTIMQA